MKLSVAIIAFNEEENLPRTLEALQGLAAEIVVLDSFSSDKTVEIAKAAGAKVFQEQWKGYVEQKNSLFEKCSGEWILNLDADEVLTPELVEEIRSKLVHDDKKINGYLINRRTFYMGRLLKYAWQPDKKLRLVRRAANPRWVGVDVHESLKIDGRTKLLANYLIHYSFKDFAAHMETTRKLAQVGAQSYHTQGRRAKARDFIIRPPFQLFKRLVIKRAVLDGVPGIMAAVSGAVHSYMKFAFLWELQNKKKNHK